MELPDRLRLIHEPARLRLMALLFRQRDVGFTAARKLLRLTDGNLAGHARRLESAGLIASRKVLTKDGFELRYAITPEGHSRFEDYLRILLEFAAQARGE